MKEEKQIWLKPKPSHIDENFDDFLNYLRNAVDKNDTLYQESLKLLRERVGILMRDRYEAPFFRQLNDADTYMFNARLCGAWLLAIKNENDRMRKEVLMVMVNSLIQYCMLCRKSLGIQESQASKSIDPLIRMALQIVSHSLPGTLVLSWPDIINNSADIFLNNFLKNDFTQPVELVFDGIGCIKIHEGEYDVLPCMLKDSNKATALRKLVKNDFLTDWHIDLYSDKDVQIKASHRNDIADIENCVDSVLMRQEKLTSKETRRIKKEYGDGDIATVEVIATGPYFVTVRSVDKDYETIERRMRWDPSVSPYRYDYPQALWSKALELGKRYRVQYDGLNDNFSMHRQFLDHIQKRMRLGTTEEACYLRPISENMNFYEFITQDGFTIFANVEREVMDSLGEDAVLDFSLTKYGVNKYAGTTYGDFSEVKYEGRFPEDEVEEDADDGDRFDPQQAQEDMVREFVEMQEVKLEESHHDWKPLSLSLLKELCCTINLLQSREPEPQVRYKMLSVLRIISVMADFKSEEQYTAYLSEYIKTLLLFARTNTDESLIIKDINVPEGLADNETIAHGTDILEILKLYSEPDSLENNEKLSEYIERDDEVLSNTAALVQCHNRLKGILEEKTLKGIKRQILLGLSALTNGDTFLELTNELEGLFGSEDDMREFKESFFFAPRTAKEQNQCYTIFKCVCGMLNNRGGVLYLGVNDRGIPIGVDDDLQNLKTQHKVQPTLDQYMLVINRMGEEWLGETAWKYVQLKAMPDYNVVAVNIEPYPYDVVALKDGKIFLRKNNSTAEVQDDSTIEDIRIRRQNARRKTDDKLIMLQDAIMKERKARFIGYHSSNSEKISNRLVEPFKIEENEYVLCYEHPDVKVFRLSRIDKVALSEEGWEHKEEHAMRDMDMFHMIGDTQIPVCLQLTVSAKNALIEEFPKAEAYLRLESSDKWRFEAKVHSLKPLMHFYLNHPATVKIINAPGLQEAVKEYINLYFS